MCVKKGVSSLVCDWMCPHEVGTNLKGSWPSKRMVLDAKDLRKLGHDSLATYQIEKHNLQTQELKGFVRQNPCRSPSSGVEEV